MNTKSKKKKKDIIFGNKDFDAPTDWEKKDIKIRITTFLDEDLLEKIKTEARLQNKKYQTYLNERLRELFMGEESIESRLKSLEEIIKKRRA
ncbi:MAG: hypothetical protein KDD34_05160 [Bdellovibrionales bacterium]|nr:hypothetical protein [Bdellovibrionales bacterium]